MHQHKACVSCIKKLAKITSRTYSKSQNNDWPSKLVRKTFLDHFCVVNNHQFVKSSSVIPGKGQGTYFTNAGMNQVTC